MLDENIESSLSERFLRYVRVHTTSSLDSTEVPSTPWQRDLAYMLRDELTDLNLSDVQCTDQACVVARLPGNCKADPIALFAHLDTAPECNGNHVNPLVHAPYKGGEIKLKNNVVLHPDEHPKLLEYVGQILITTDGTSLLGADDKAGIAEIMTIVEHLIRHPEIPHGEIVVVFNPDEEIGKGTRSMPDLGVQYGITLDGQYEGEVEYECFNASMAHVTFSGRSIHTGIGKNRLVNAITLAQRFLSLLPQAESPEATDGMDGFFAPIGIEGGIEKTVLTVLLRDFESEGLALREQRMRDMATAVAATTAGGEVQVDLIPQYRNMKKMLDAHPNFCKLLMQAIEHVGVQPEIRQIRGGTDGALLAERGIAVPNLFTGAMAIHGPYEWIALPAMIKAVESVITFLQLWTGKSETIG